VVNSKLAGLTINVNVLATLYGIEKGRACRSDIPFLRFLNDR
jgi:hypothetical protein